MFCSATYCFGSGMAARRAEHSDQNSMFYVPLVVYTVLITFCRELGLYDALGHRIPGSARCCERPSSTRTIRTIRALASQDDLPSPRSSDSLSEPVQLSLLVINLGRTVSQNILCSLGHS